MEKDFYVVTNEWGEENVFEDRMIEDVVNEFSKLYHGNHLQVIWSLVDLMKSNYENRNDEAAELYYGAIVSVIKDRLAVE